MQPQLAISGAESDRSKILPKLVDFFGVPSSAAYCLPPHLVCLSRWSRLAGCFDLGLLTSLSAYLVTFKRCDNLYESLEMDENQLWNGVDPFWSENLMLGLVGCYQIHLLLLDLEPVSTTSSTIDYIIIVY